jgi:hypothetical protein
VSVRRQHTELVIPLRAKGLARGFPAAVVASAIGVALWIALARSWNSYIYGGGWLVWCVWFGGTLYAIRRARGSEPLQIVATDKELRGPTWAIDWDRVDRMKIGYMNVAGGSVKTLAIAALRAEDVRRSKSVALRLNSLLSSAMRMPDLRINQANVDMPLEEMAAEFERLAGRSLLV